MFEMIEQLLVMIISIKLIDIKVKLTLLVHRILRNLMIVFPGNISFPFE